MRENEESHEVLNAQEYISDNHTTILMVNAYLPTFYMALEETNKASNSVVDTTYV